MNTILSSSLLAASMLVGQSADAPKSAVPPPAIIQTAPTPPQRPLIGWFTREDRPILNRIGSWFKRDSQEKKEAPMGKDMRETVVPAKPSASPSSNDFPRKLPNPTSQAAPTKEIQQAALNPAAPANTVTYPIRPQLTEKIGRDDNFEWITGQLEIEKGKHVIYYATPETIDKYKGRLVLDAAKTDLSKLRPGDLISVRGQIVPGTVPTYRITIASLIERPKL